MVNLDKDMQLLHHCLQLAPEHSHVSKASMLGYLWADDHSRAKDYTMQARSTDPNITWA
jgi:hypothetical protein